MSMEQIARDIIEDTFPRKPEATLREEASPREYLKIKYSTDTCKCGNCQLVPPEKLVAWADEIDQLRALVPSAKFCAACGRHRSVHPYDLCGIFIPQEASTLSSTNLGCDK